MDNSTASTSNLDQGPRERILKAALDLFVEQGYFNTNVPDVSKRSRCSVGSIYHHFLNKEEIAAQLYSDGIKQFRAALGGALRDNVSLQQAIHDIVVTFLTFAEENQLLARYLWLARHREFLSKELAKPTMVGFDHTGRVLTKAFKDAIRKNEIPNIKAQVIWSIVFGIPLSFIQDWLDGYTQTQPHVVAETIANACWAALKGAKG